MPLIQPCPAKHSHHIASRKFLLLLALSACTWLAACAASPPPSAVPGANAAPRDTLVIAQPIDPPTLDPFNTAAPYISVFAQMCEPLMYWDTDAAGNAIIKPWLATEYHWVNNTTLQFKLRSNVQFSNGEPFDAQAARVSLEQLFQSLSYSQWLQNLLQDVEIVDDHTVNVVLTQPAPYVTSVLAMGSFQIAPRDFQTRGAAAFNQSPVCTGPWLLKEHVKDSSITLTANPQYWGGTPKFRELIYRIIPDDTARVAALEAGEVDIAPGIPHSAADRIAANRDLHLLSIPSLRQFAVHFDIDSPNGAPLKNDKVRLALNLAIDRAAMCQQIFAGRCTPLQGQFLTASHTGFNPDLKPYPYDPVQAKQLLADAGYPNGFDVDYTYTVGRYPLDKPAGEAIAAYLRAIGLRVNEQVVDFTEWQREFDARPRETTALFTTGFLFSPDGYLVMLSYLPGKRFRTSVMPPEFDALMDKAARTENDAERIQLVQQAQAVLHDAPFAVYLYSIDDLYGVQNWMQGLKPRPDQTLRLTEMGVMPKNP